MRARRLVSITESDYMQTIIEAARVWGWLVYHAQNSLHSEPGFPDLVLVRPPQVLFVEVKGKLGRLRSGYQGATRWMPGQDEWLTALRACKDVKADVWRPDMWAEIERVLGR